MLCVGNHLGPTFGGLEDTNGCQSFADNVASVQDSLEPWWGHWILPRAYSLGVSFKYFLSAIIDTFYRHGLKHLRREPF